ncbi:MAG: SDR family NAD(P)-dependent oxidoreductase [Lachnospiraceae bacterium]|nr:SDR family NAD(P)-dependent oxidoreductase [Eubacterium sp.]MBR1910077.1 SDR family NAD(P)-dependent oxidoreductase [Lachnospiraceae bacterium]
MRAVLITGASRGIGRSTALAFAWKDYDVLVLNSRTDNGSLEELAGELEKINSSIRIITSYGNAGDGAYIDNLHERLINAGIEVELLINNAAVSYVGLLTDMNSDDWNETVSTNLTSVFNTCHAFVPDMVRAGKGRIINISSVWGLVGASCEVAYSATKGAVNAFTKALAKELAPSGVSVNAAAFGVIDTDMNKNLSEEEKAVLEEEIPIGRMASPEEAAELIVKLSEMPAYFTGEVVKFDGGWI